MPPKIAAAVLALALMGAAGARAEPPVRGGTFRVTNATDRVVECNFLIDSVTHTYLRVHPGKTYQTDISANRLLQLVCMRGKEGVYGPLEFGVDYRFVRDGDHVAVVAGS